MPVEPQDNTRVEKPRLLPRAEGVKRAAPQYPTV